MVNIINLAICLVIGLYNLPLAILGIAYIGFTSLMVKSLWVDAIMLISIMIISLINFNLNFIVSQFHFLLNFYYTHNIIQILEYQIFNWHVIYQNGIALFLLPIFIIRVLNNWGGSSNNKTAVQQEFNLNIHDGTVLNKQQHPVIIKDSELNQHCLIIGTTGSGKTTTIFKFINSYAKRNLPIIYLDGKGSTDLIDKLRLIAQENNRKFKVFSLRPLKNIAELSGYNPFSSGTATEWKNRIMSLFTQAQSRGQEHFSLGEQNYINFVANILYKWGKDIDLRLILALLEQPEKLLNLAQKVDPVIALKLAQLHNDSKVNKLVGDVIKLMELFIYSDYGELFSTIEMANVIKIKESILNNEMILFLFDASAYAEDTQKIARMVINDINSSFAEFDTFTKCLCVFDEFASYASENLADTISLQRSKGMHAIVGTQSIATVKLKSESTKRIAEELIACCNTFIIHQINHIDDAENLAKIIGTRKTYEVTSQIDSKLGGATGLGTVKNVDEFKIHPQVLKELKTGEAVIYQKVCKTGTNLHKIKIGH